MAVQFFIIVVLIRIASPAWHIHLSTCCGTVYLRSRLVPPWFQLPQPLHWCGHAPPPQPDRSPRGYPRITPARRPPHRSHSKQPERCYNDAQQFRQVHVAKASTVPHEGARRHQAPGSPPTYRSPSRRRLHFATAGRRRPDLHRRLPPLPAQDRRAGPLPGHRSERVRGGDDLAHPQPDDRA